jgi:hypothetical protein
MLLFQDAQIFAQEKSRGLSFSLISILLGMIFLALFLVKGVCKIQDIPFGGYHAAKQNR